jgi:hypothetical protein
MIILWRMTREPLQIEWHSMNLMIKTSTRCKSQPREDFRKRHKYKGLHPENRLGRIKEKN